MMSVTFKRILSTQRVNRCMKACATTLLSIGMAASGWAAQSVSLAWDPQEAGSNYTVYYGTESGNYTSQIDAGASTSTLITGLREGERYYIAVSARDASGVEGAPCPEISYLAPGVLVASRAANTNSAVHMKFPVAAAHSYDVQASPDMLSWQTIWTTTGISNIWVDFEDSRTNSVPARYYRLILR